MSEPSGVLRRGHTVVEFTDQFGDARVIHRLKGQRLAVKRQGNTPAHAFNRAAAVIIGKNVKEQRIKAKMTMDELCRRSGLAAAPGQGKQRIYEIENCLRREGVRIGTLYALAVALDVPIGKLMPSKEAVQEAAGVEFKWNETLATAS